MLCWLCYVDESYDDEKFCLSAIAIRHGEWHRCFDAVRDHRRMLRDQYGVFMRREIHANELVSGRGRYAPRELGKYKRSLIFRGILELIARLPVQIFNIALPRAGDPDVHMRAWDRLVNRIQRTLIEYERKHSVVVRNWASQIFPRLPAGWPPAWREAIATRLADYHPRAIIVADEGQETEIIRALRRMRVINYIPSRYGLWPEGRPTRNIVADRLIEDPVFRASHDSPFLQLADCVAFSLLKQEVTPTPRIKKYRIHQMFNILEPVCVLSASTRDPQGIVRR